MPIGLKIIIRLVFRPKKYKCHPGLFGAHKVFLWVVANIDRLLGFYHQFFHGHVKQPDIRFLESQTAMTES